jgi:histone H3/H4
MIMMAFPLRKIYMRYYKRIIGIIGLVALQGSFFWAFRGGKFDFKGGKRMPILPVAPVSRLIREAGAKRVSEGARDALAEVLESYGLEVAREAVGWASHAKRKTVKSEDIREAVKRVKPPAISER